MTEATSQYTVFDAKRESLRQTERMVEEQGKLTLAANQRAVQFTSAIGVMLTLSVQLQPRILAAEKLQVLSLGALVIAAFLCALTFVPRPFAVAGARAETLREYLNEHYCADLLDELMKRNDDLIRTNNYILLREAEGFKRSMIFAAIGLGLLVLQIVIPTFISGIKG